MTDDLLALHDALTDGARWYEQPAGQPCDIAKLLADMLAYLRMRKAREDACEST